MTITRSIVRANLRSKAVIGIMAAGIFLSFAVPILFGAMLPHKELVSEDYIGLDPESITIDFPAENGSTLQRSYNATDGLEVEGQSNIYGYIEVNGTLTVEGGLSFAGNISGDGFLSGGGDGNYTVQGTLDAYGSVELHGTISGQGAVGGSCVLNGTGAIYSIESSDNQQNTDEQTDDDVSVVGEMFGGVLKSAFIILFTILLAAVVCADLIAEDLRSNSFVLYFSRPISPQDYLAGKFLGAYIVLAIFTVIPLAAFGIAMTATQTGNDYAGSLKQICISIAAGAATAGVFIPLGLMVSSMTKRRAYAGVGIFITFFVLTLIAAIFAEIDADWMMASPILLMQAAYDGMFGRGLPDGVDLSVFASTLAVMVAVPAAFVYWKIVRKGAGR